MSRSPRHQSIFRYPQLDADHTTRTGKAKDSEGLVKDVPALGWRTPRTWDQIDDKGNISKKARLQARSEPPDWQSIYNLNRDEALEYGRDFNAPGREAERDRLEKNRGSPEETDRFKRLKKAYKVYKAAEYQLKKAKNPKEKAPDLTQKQGEALRPFFNAYQKEFVKRYSTAELNAFRNGQGDPKIQGRFNELYKPAMTFHNWDRRMRRRREQVAPESGLYSPEQLKKLENLYRNINTNYRKHIRYRNHYVNGEEVQATQARLRSGRGTHAELEEFRDLERAHKAVTNAQRSIKKMGRLVQIEFDKGLQSNVQELEKYRHDYNEYRKEFGGPHNKQRRADLEAGRGPADVLARYRSRRPGYLAYITLYSESWEQARKKSADDEEDLDDDNDIDEDKMEIKAFGRMRYFRPTYKHQKQVRQDSAELEHNDFRFSIVDGKASLQNSAKDVPIAPDVVGSQGLVNNLQMSRFSPSDPLQGQGELMSSRVPARGLKEMAEKPLLTSSQDPSGSNPRLGRSMDRRIKPYNCVQDVSAHSEEWSVSLLTKCSLDDRVQPPKTNARQPPTTILHER